MPLLGLTRGTPGSPSELPARQYLPYGSRTRTPDGNRRMTAKPSGPPLRAWQREALTAYETAQPQDFLATATPGAGKTTFALILALRLKTARIIDRIIVVAPTDHLRTQWAMNALAFGLTLDPNLKNSTGPVRAEADGYVTTYAQVAAHPILHRRRTETKRTLVILDEIHHAGDALTWGEAIREAFTPAARRLSLTGTPFRTKPEERIPFVRYDALTDGELESTADYTYGYGQALADGVVRPVMFAAYAGRSRWRNSAGDVLTATLGEGGTKKSEEAAWRTALNASGRWVPHVLVAANQRITDLRESGMPDAAGLLLATDQDAARAYAQVLELVTGVTPVLVLSDDPRSNKRIAEFARSTDRWIVAVKMVSEGVDVPRIACIAWMTSFRTPLFFAQAVGRAVRARNSRETATVFLPAVRPLLALAAAMEEERNHVVTMKSTGDGLDLVEFERVDTEPGLTGFEALDAEAEFAHVLQSGRAIVAPLTVEEEDYLGLPGLLAPEQMASLLAARDAELRKTNPRQQTLTDDTPASWQELENMRREIARLARQLAVRRRKSHSDIHVDIRKAVPGPPSADAPLAVLTARRDWLLSKVVN
jgi:superfamily II DNA or RNA helicase